MVRRNSYCRIVCCTSSTRVLCSDLTRASALLPQTATCDFGQLKAWLSSKTLNSRGRPDMSGKRRRGDASAVGSGWTDGKGRRAESTQPACASRHGWSSARHKQRGERLGGSIHGSLNVSQSNARNSKASDGSRPFESQESREHKYQHKLVVSSSSSEEACQT